MTKAAFTSLLIVLFLGISAGTALSDVTHKVRSGDSLYTIAKKNRVSVDTLKKLNGLSATTKLKLGQIVVVRKDAEVTRKRPASKQVEAAISEDDGEFIEYRTRKGDTLEKLALRFNIDKDDIIEANNFKGKRISPNRTILIPRVSEESGEEVVALVNIPLNNWKSSEEKYMLVKVAKSFMGAPYKYGGESVRGLDCSAFVKKMYSIFDVQLPRSAREQYRVGARIQKEELAVGDLVFFKTKRYSKYPTHASI